MSPIYVPGKVTLRQTYIGTDDPDAAAYIAAVEAADEIASPGIGGLETATKVAIHSFVKGCKNDGIWPAIKASCILAGARTLNGALVPLVKQPADSAPARFGTEGGWNYNRETGLQGNGADNYLDSNRNNNADPQNNAHVAVYASTVGSIPASGFNCFIGSGTNSSVSRVLQLNSSGNTTFKIHSASLSTVIGSFAGFLGAKRSDPSNIDVRINSTSTTLSQASANPTSGSLTIFQRAAFHYSDARIAFYSIGESLPDGPTKTGLELLDERVSALITAIGVAIP